MALAFNPHDTTQAALSLQSVILNQALSYVSKYPYYATEFTAGLESVVAAVESAYVLVEKAALPKVALSSSTSNILTFSLAGDSGVPFHVSRGCTPERARKIASKWLAIAAHIEAEEKIKAKKKADAEYAAKVARAKELDRIATFHFGKPISELSANKASAIEEIYRLEQVIAEEDAA